MDQPLATRAVEVLTDGDPKYDELLALTEDLRTASAETPYERTSQRALCQVVGEFVEHPNSWSDIWKRVLGATKTQERERILYAFDEPIQENPLKQVSAIVE